MHMYFSINRKLISTVHFYSGINILYYIRLYYIIFCIHVKLSTKYITAVLMLVEIQNIKPANNRKGYKTCMHDWHIQRKSVVLHMAHIKYKSSLI